MMLTEDVIKIYQQSLERLDEILIPNISGAVMPFSDSDKIEEAYIYTGEEKIPFNERIPEYQQIFRDEFL
ncbi:MAG: hypothetical protein ACFE8B_13850 [Candidatus Hermodarchaeota archaeon]